LEDRALLSLRCAPLLTGARGRPAVDVGAAARLAAGAGDLLLQAGLDLLELNPVIVHEQGAVAVDALARTKRCGRTGWPRALRSPASASAAPRPTPAAA
jgi:hypothetical protein